jgi:hypothetical protein
MQKPAAINITKNPLTKNNNVFKAYAVSSSMAADALTLNKEVNNNV